MPTRRTYVAATLNGAAVTAINSASCTYGVKRVPEATIYVPRVPQNVATWLASHAYGVGAFVKPTVRNGHVYKATVGGTSGGSQPTWPTTTGASVANGSVTWTEAGVDIVYNDVGVLSLGAGTHNINRFYGLFRHFDYKLWPRAVGLVFYGRMIRLVEYQNRSDPLRVGGLTLLDLLGSATGTDEAVVEAVLTTAGAPFSAGNIGGTGVTFGTRALPTTFLWRAGTSTNPLIPMRAAGQSARAYIQDWDKVSAVYTNPTSPVGFYVTYETVNGIFRALIGGRPRSTADLTFTEGIDIHETARGERGYPIANGAFVTGWDTGLAGYGPVRNMVFDATTVANTGAFLGQASNPLMDIDIVQDFGSPFIEWGTEAEAGVGMNCERVGNALLADLNRESVTARFRTPLDDLILPGYTILVQGPGGQPDGMGMGEKLWVDDVTTGVAEDGEFYQDLGGTGGGEDAYTAAPPG